MDATDVNELLEQACTLSDEGRKTEAVELYQQIIQLSADWSVPYFNLGLLYKYDCQWEKSFYYNQKAVELAPDEQAGW
jgi:tetratricopeptide (TPR) repeat protein